MKKIGFIGYGNMGQMIINNILSLNLINPEKMIISTRTIAKLDKIEKQYPEIEITDDNGYLAKNCNKIFIFIETPEFQPLLEEINSYLDENSYLIHVCAGLNFGNIANIYKGPVSQVIPSIISTYNKSDHSDKLKYPNGVSLITHNEKVNTKNKDFCENLFSKFSYIKTIKTIENNEDMKIATILTSCGPAFISLIIRKIAIIANSYSQDLTIEDMENLLIKTFYGTSKQLDNDNLAISEIITKTATKKGITETGLRYLDEEIDEIAINLFNQLFEKYSVVEDRLNSEYSINQ
ncbi:MAG: NAD(P)-binding domain-containing protein [Methanobrevibacter sp.]|jgi:pyrroline-5-carboxylate reductase|nr:NAD(P)-binding domain-containing protein [Methanobrevibacter sp.]